MIVYHAVGEKNCDVASWMNCIWECRRSINSTNRLDAWEGPLTPLSEFSRTLPNENRRFGKSWNFFPALNRHLSVPYSFYTTIMTHLKLVSPAWSVWREVLHRASEPWWLICLWHTMTNIYDPEYLYIVSFKNEICNTKNQNFASSSGITFYTSLEKILFWEITHLILNISEI